MGLMLLLACGSPLARAQQKEAAPLAALADAVVDDNLNLDVELYLLAASDASTSSAASGKLPSALEPVIAQLRSTLPFEHYRLAATMFNRMKNGGRVVVKGVGATPFSKIDAAAPLFSDYYINSVTLKNDATGQAIVELLGFRFGARVPIQSSAIVPGGSGATMPTIQYEPTGIETAFSMREGEPVIVGTLNVGQPGEAFILVASAKRTRQR
jgi:hypothetical protein